MTGHFGKGKKREKVSKMFHKIEEKLHVGDHKEGKEHKHHSTEDKAEHHDDDDEHKGEKPEEIHDGKNIKGLMDKIKQNLKAMTGEDEEEGEEGEVEEGEEVEVEFEFDFEF